MNCSNTYCHCSNPCCSGGCTCKSTTTTSTTTIPFVCPEENCDEIINLDCVVYSGANSDCLNIYKNQRLDDVIRSLFTSATGIDCFPEPTTTTSTTTTPPPPPTTTTTSTTTIPQEEFLCFNFASLEAGQLESITKSKQGNGIYNNKPYYIIEGNIAVYWNGLQWIFTKNWNTTKDAIQVFTQITQYPISEQSDWVPDSTIVLDVVAIINVIDGVCPPPTTTSTTTAPQEICFYGTWDWESCQANNYTIDQNCATFEYAQQAGVLDNEYVYYTIDSSQVASSPYYIWFNTSLNRWFFGPDLENVSTAYSYLEDSSDPSKPIGNWQVQVDDIIPVIPFTSFVECTSTLCLNYSQGDKDDLITFTEVYYPDGTHNGKPKYTSFPFFDYVIYWNIATNRWELSDVVDDPTPFAHLSYNGNLPLSGQVAANAQWTSISSPENPFEIINYTSVGELESDEYGPHGPCYLPICFSIFEEATGGGQPGCLTSPIGVYNNKPYYKILNSDCTLYLTRNGDFGFVYWSIAQSKWLFVAAPEFGDPETIVAELPTSSDNLYPIGVWTEINGIPLLSTMEKSELECPPPPPPTTTSTTTQLGICGDCGFTLNSIPVVGALSIEALTSTTCNIEEYVIDWYLNSVTSPDDTFVSASSAGVGIDNVHPFTGSNARPVLGGNWIPVIRNVVINGITYDSQPDQGGTYSPDLVTCLLPITVENLNCNNGTNTITNPEYSSYSHYINYVNTISNPADANKTIRFDIDAVSTNFLAFAFGNISGGLNNISDRLTLIYHRANGTVVQTLYDIAAGEDIPATDLTGSLKLVKTPLPVKYVVPLTSIPGGRLAGDYITAQIQAGYIDSNNPNTNWGILLKCLETFDQSIPNIRVAPDPCVTATVDGCYFNYEIQYPGFIDPVTTDFFKYVISTSDSINNTLTLFKLTGISCQAIVNAFSEPCQPISGGTQFTITKTGNTFVVQFASATQFNEWQTAYNNAFTHNSGFSTNPVDLEYYRYYQVKLIENITNCGDSGSNENFMFHRSSTFTFDSGTNTLTIVGQTGFPSVGNYNGPTGACTNCDEEFYEYNACVSTLGLIDQVWTINVDLNNPITGFKFVLNDLNNTNPISLQIGLTMSANLFGYDLSTWCVSPFPNYGWVYYIQAIYIQFTNISSLVDNFKVYNTLNPTISGCIDSPGPSNLIYEEVGGVVTTPSGGCP